MVDLNLKSLVVKMTAKALGNSKNKFFFEIPQAFNDVVRNKTAEVSFEDKDDKLYIVYEVSKSEH